MVVRMKQLAQTYPQLAVQLAGCGWPSSDFALVRRAHDEAAALFVGAERGSAKPFIDHLVGTASGVILGGGTAETVAAALLHAAYDQGDFGGRGWSEGAARRRLVDVVGPVVEDLVHRYSRLAWSADLIESIARTVGSAVGAERQVLLIRVANEVDDAVDGGLVLSRKAEVDIFGSAPRRAVVRIAEAVAADDLVAMARAELLGDQRSFPEELIPGGGESHWRLPRSARPGPGFVLGRFVTQCVRRVRRRHTRLMSQIRLRQTT